MLVDAGEEAGDDGFGVAIAAVQIRQHHFVDVHGEDVDAVLLAVLLPQVGHQLVSGDAPDPGAEVAGGIIGFQLKSLLAKASLSKIKTRLATPALFLAAGFLGIWTWALTWEERYWISVDDFGTPTGHFFTQYEADLFSQYHQELGEFLP